MQINTGARTNNLTGCFTFFLTLIGSQTTFNLEVHVNIRLMSLWFFKGGHKRVTVEVY